MFNTGQALPLRERRTWCPRMRRGGHAEYPRKINRSWTWYWPVYGLDSARDRTQTRTFHVRKQSASAFSPRQKSWPRTIHVHAQAMALIVREHATATDVDCPQTVRSRDQSVSANWSRTRLVRDRGPAKNYPRLYIAESFQPMSSFDPATVRQAVAEFTPLRPQKFQDLIPAKDVIIELRQRRASYRAIATLLTQHCLPTSKTAIATFCHQILGEIVRPHRRAGRKRPASPAEPNGRMATPTHTESGEIRPSQEPPADSNGSGIPQIRSRGPRIAQVRILKPENT